MLSPAKIHKSIVFVGKFNPAIFQPSWFSLQKLISYSDGESAGVNIIHPDVVNFNLNWCSVEIARERAVFATNQENAFELIRDLSIGTFRLLSHTPINQLGINTEMHFQMRSVSEWHSIGHQMAPKEQFWSDTLINPGMLCVAIQGQRPDKYNGAVKVEVRPSNIVNNGIVIRINDHFEKDSEEEIIGCDYIINALENEWENSHQRAVDIINNIFDKMK